MAGVVVEMTSDERRLFAGMQKLITQQGGLERSFKKTGDAAKKAGKDADSGFGDRGAQQIARYAAGLLSVGGAVAAVNRGYETWLRNIRETAAESEKAARQAITLASIQEGGQARAAVMASAAAASQFGITDRGVAFDVVQSLQSALGGDFKKGLAAAREVFAASLVGVPLELGKEASIQSIAAGRGPSEFLRSAFVVGQASGRDPEMLAKAAPGLAFIQDKQLGFAFAGVLADKFGNELETYLKSAGIALSGSADERFLKTLKKLGVAQGTPLDRLSALRAAGIVSPEQLKAAGLGEIRQQAAVSNLIEQLDRIPFLVREQQTKAVEGVFSSTRARIESEIPQTMFERQISQLRAEIKDVQAFGDGSIPALRQERRELARGLVFRRLGIEQGLVMDYIDETGRVSDFAMGRFKAGAGVRALLSATTGFPDAKPLPPADAIDRSIDSVLKNLDDAFMSLQSGAAAMERASVRLEGATIRLTGGGLTMMPVLIPGEDR